MSLKVGDTVAYAAEFLRSIVDLSKRSADMRGKITKIEDMGQGFVIATVDGDFNICVNVKNLRRVKNRMVIE